MFSSSNKLVSTNEQTSDGAGTVATGAATVHHWSAPAHPGHLGAGGDRPREAATRLRASCACVRTATSSTRRRGAHAY